jgi:two-component system sensor histidine kinase AlgZ
VDWWWVARNVLIGGIFASMAMRYFYVQSQWQFKTQAELNARLAALQANIRPHFFFNTLNTVSSLIAIDPDKAERMLLDLAQLFRAVLKQDDSLILLQDEIELGKRYLDIEQVRLGERMRVHWHVPEPLPAIKVPQLLLQPLLENAVYHGVAPSVDGGQIDIYVHEEKQLWRLEIHNTKVASGTTGGNRIAQANIAARLEALGQGARLQIDESAAQYRVQLWLPRD